MSYEDFEFLIAFCRRIDKGELDAGSANAACALKTRACSTFPCADWDELLTSALLYGSLDFQCELILGCYPQYWNLKGRYPNAYPRFDALARSLEARVKRYDEEAGFR